LIVAVNITACAYADGFTLDETETVELALLMVKFSLCGLVEPV